MKKQFILSVLVINIMAFLAACGAEKTEQVDINDYTYSSEKIEVFLPGESEPLETITDNQAIEQFVDNLNFETWEVKSIPAGSIEGTIYKLYDRETAKFGESIEDKELYESGSIIVYSNEPYIEFKTTFLNFSFKVPAEVQKSLLK